MKQTATKTCLSPCAGATSTFFSLTTAAATAATGAANCATDYIIFANGIDSATTPTPVDRYCGGTVASTPICCKLDFKLEDLFTIA